MIRKKTIHLLSLSICLVLLSSGVVCAEQTPRSHVLFDESWRFHRGDVDGAEKAAFDDSTWRVLDLPHDWSIEDVPGTDSPIDPDATGGIDMGYFTNGTAWYRKTFEVGLDLKGKKLELQFDGVYMNADVWLNGKHLGNHPYGYTTFWYDITDRVRINETNVLAVEVKNEGRNSRWYSGSGIYRHVWLSTMEPVHIAHWGTYITTPDVTESCAKVRVHTTVKNSGAKASVAIETTILDAAGNEVTTATLEQDVSAASEATFVRLLSVDSVALWSPDSPALYCAIEKVTVNGRMTDQTETTFGIRTIAYNVEQGFLLNGVPTLMKGGCMHHDNGPLGSAAYDRAEERRVELMKASGFNAIRCAHNPPSEAFLEACDRIGMLVIDESFDMWSHEKNPQDYHLYFDQWWERDIDSMVLRDRNHPSIVMWSTGNEIPERGKPEGVETSRKLATYIRSLDETRPITAAVNGLNPDKDPFFATLDIAGYNYAVGGDHWQELLYSKDNKRVPDRIMYCAESYPLEAFGSWMAVVDLPYVFGDFVWTGYDYLGEASIGWLGYEQEGSFYPWNHAFCGDIDICGFKRPQSYYRDALWQNGRKVSIFVTPPKPSFEETNPKLEKWSKWNWQDVVANWNWTGHEGKRLPVVVYSSCEEIELLLNGKSLGKKETSRKTKFIAKWDVEYRPGTLKAVGFVDGNQVDSWELRTADKPMQIRLTPDKTKLNTNGQDLSYIAVELLDNAGIRNPTAENLITFEIEGPGSIAAVASSNPRSPESYQLPKRKAYQGRCLVIVKSGRQPGTIRLKASSEGLKSAEVELRKV